MLFCGDARHRLEPMREVGGAFLDSPVLHSVCNDVRNAEVKVLAVLYRLLKRLVGFLWEPCFHSAVVKNH